MNKLMLDEIARQAKDPEVQKAMLELIMRKRVEPDYESLLEDLLVDIAKDRDMVRIMSTKKSMANAVTAMKHLWE